MYSLSFNPSYTGSSSQTFFSISPSFLDIFVSILLILDHHLKLQFLLFICMQQIRFQSFLYWIIISNIIIPIILWLHKRVSILLILDHHLKQFWRGFMDQKRGKFQSFLYWIIISNIVFNCNVEHSRIGFNPSYTGSSSQTCTYDHEHPQTYRVSILLILDHHLKPNNNTVTMKGAVSFNPSYTGSSSQTFP